MSQTKAELVNGLNLNTASDDAATIDSSGRLLVGKTTSKASDGENVAKAQIESTGNCMLDIAANGTTSSSYAGLNLIRSDGSSVNDHTAVDSGDRIGRINFIGADGSDRFNDCASIRAFAAADFTANNCPGHLTFSTNGGGPASTERMRLFSDGGMAIGTTTAAGMLNSAGTSYFGADANVKVYAHSSSTEARLGAGGITTVSNVPFTFFVADGGSNFEAMRILTDGRVVIKAADFNAAIGSSNKGISIGDTNTGTLFAAAGTTTQNHIIFVNPNGAVGRIQTNGSSTTFATSSDYRLKENAVSISDGITRLKALKPYRFNFKKDASTTLDGFFAHEVQTVVPQAVDGTKDELYTEDNKFGEYEAGDPKYQSIDHSTLVPLITAALQESITKIETLETKVAALEAA